MASLPDSLLPDLAPRTLPAVPARARKNRTATPRRATDQGEPPSPSFLDRCLAIQEHERLQIGRELHDSTGQMVLTLRLDFARLRLAGQLEGEAILCEIDDTLRQVEQQIRSISFLKYPAQMVSAGIGQSLRALVHGFGRRSGIDSSFTCDCDDERIGGDVALALLRVTQEALVNIHRHAQAANVRVRLGLHGDRLELVILDDGLGITAADEAAASLGLGVRGMRHRIEYLGGSFVIRRQRQGTRIVATLPPTAWCVAD